MLPPSIERNTPSLSTPFSSRAKWAASRIDSVVVSGRSASALGPQGSSTAGDRERANKARSSRHVYAGPACSAFPTRQPSSAGPPQRRAPPWSIATQYNVTKRSAERIPTHKPRWGFWKGLLTGAAIEVPVLAVTVWLLARLGFGNPEAPMMRIIRLTAVFAGVAAVFTAGGIGRLSAYASLAFGGRRRADVRGGRARMQSRAQGSC